MDLRELRYFVTLADHLNFHRAAETLGITQPALSNAIKRLEDSIAVELFDRSRKRHLTLTPAGRTFLEGARQTIAEGERAVNRAQAEKAGRLGYLSIGHTEDFIADLLPESITEFSRDCPNVVVDITPAASFNLSEMLLRGSLDCIFQTSPLPNDLNECESEKLPPTPIVLIVSRKHRLRNERLVQLSDLVGENFIDTPSHRLSPYDRALQHLLLDADLEINSRIKPISAGLTTELVAKGHHIAFATEGSLPSRLANVKMLYVDHPHAELGRAVVWRKNNSNPVLVRYLSVLRASASKTSNLASRPK